MGLGRLLFVVFLAVAAHRIIKYITSLDLQKVVHHHEPGPCHLVPGAEEGTEDIQVLSNGIALITTALRFPLEGNYITSKRKSKILKFDFNNPEAGVEEVKIVNVDEMLELNFHGISLWEDRQSGKVSVFVVNHPTKAETDHISIFDYDVKSNQLRHLKSVSHRDFGLLNDVVAVGPESFYTTRLYYSRTNTLLQMMELYLQIKGGAVIYHDGKDGRIVDSGLNMANGINVSPDGKMIYVSAFLDGVIKLYKRENDNSLIYIRDLALGTKQDNLNVDIENGDIWTAAHPIWYQFLQHIDDPMKPSPSQVLRIRIQEDNDFVEEVFSDPGIRLHASTTAERYKDAILIGTLSHKLMYCQLKLLSSF